MTWLDAATVTAILGPKLSADLEDGDALQKACDATRSHVEDRRSDLFESDNGDPPVFTFAPTPSVIHGAALYAHRLYHRRKSPTAAGLPGTDADIEKLLGIGKARRFRFGGARVPDAEAVV